MKERGEKEERVTHIRVCLEVDWSVIYSKSEGPDTTFTKYAVFRREHVREGERTYIVPRINLNIDDYTDTVDEGL